MENSDKTKNSKKSENKIKPPSGKRKFLKWGLILCITLLIILIVVTTVLLAYPLERKSFTSEVDQESCSSGIFVLPNHYKENDPNFTYEFNERLTIFDRYDILAREVCFKPDTLLSENRSYSPEIYLAYNFLFPKSAEIKTLNYPTVNATDIDFNVAMPTNKDLVLTLNKSNQFLDYRILANEKENLCTKEELLLKCNLFNLSLEQGKEYPIEIASFNSAKKIKTHFETVVKTVAPMMVTAASITPDQMIYDHLSPYSFTFNEKISKQGNILLELVDKNSGSRTAVENTIEVSEVTLTVKPNAKLTANSYFEITIHETTGESGAYVQDPYKIGFQTSSVPIVLGSNLKAVGVIPNSRIYIELDQPLKLDQNIKSLVSFSEPKDFSVYMYGNVITVIPTGFGSCESATINLSEGVLNAYGVSTSTPYSYTFKTSCVAVTTIGTSVGGKPINAFVFGGGPRTVLFHGAIHGSEGGTYSMMSSWINELEAGSARIPADKRVVVIPVMNPDGLARGDRINNNGVDLNRNFLTSNWQQETYLTGGIVYPNGGGSAPFSEPETVALRNAMLTYQPYMTVSFHAAGGYVISNGSGSSNSIASQYGAISGYTYIPAESSGTVFDYSITGSFDDWALDNGLSTILVEAFGHGNEIARNREAMWWLIGL